MNTAPSGTKQLACLALIHHSKHSPPPHHHHHPYHQHTVTAVCTVYKVHCRYSSDDPACTSCTRGLCYRTGCGLQADVNTTTCTFPSSCIPARLGYPSPFPPPSQGQSAGSLPTSQFNAPLQPAVQGASRLSRSLGQPERGDRCQPLSKCTQSQLSNAAFGRLTQVERL